MLKIKTGSFLLLILLFLLNACTSVTLPVGAGSVLSSPYPTFNPATVTPLPIGTNRPPQVLATLHPDFTDSPTAALDPTASPTVFLDPTATSTAALDPTASPGVASSPSATLAPTVRPTATPNPTATLLPLSGPTFTPNVPLVRQGPGMVVCPILLYHRIETTKTKDPYFIAPDDFRAQMQALKDWGYTPISATQLVQAINYGADLPVRPIVITFDDGDESVYTNAFPIMRELGFTGVNYIIVTYIGTDGYMTVDQLKELAAAGWETGSHSMTHADLTKSDRIEWEMVESRYMLGRLLKVPVNTFAYPYGRANPDMYSVLTKNYQAGMGLGVSVTQRGRDLWYLWRRPVELGVTLQTFASYLPWSTPLP